MWTRLRSASLLVMVSVASTGYAGGKVADDSKKDPPAGDFEARFVDDSAVRLDIRESKITLETDHGTLSIPITQVKRIQFAQRIPEDVVKRTADAIADLGHTDFRRRENASKTLLKFKGRAYPALMNVKSEDAEVRRRVEHLLELIREACPLETLEWPTTDIIHTASSKIAGTIKADSLRVVTLPFGEQSAKLCDLRSLRVSGFDDSSDLRAADVLPDPGYVNALVGQVGKSFRFRVTAPPAQALNQLGIWGTDVYTADTSLVAAAVHAGIVRPGETGVVRVTMVGQHPGFLASNRNGITSGNFGPFAGFRVEPKRAPER